MPDDLSHPTIPSRTWRDSLLPKLQSRNVAIGVALATLVVVGAFAVHAVMQRNEIAALTQAIADKTTSLAEATKRLGDQSTAMADTKKRSDAALAASAVEVSNLKLSVDAFARQAASCDLVKRQLNITESP